MGYIQHDAVIVTTSHLPPEFPLPDIEAFRASLPNDMRHLVVGPIEGAMNSYYTYIFVPDGSKEGWEHSNIGDEHRERFKNLFRGAYEDGSSPVDWVHIRYGGDFGAENERPQIVDFRQ